MFLAAALAPGQSGAKSASQNAPSAEDQVLGQEQHYMAAMIKGDRPELEKILGSDYVSVAATGHVLDRATTLGFYKPNQLKDATVDQMTVRLYGGTAVVVGRYTQVDDSGTWVGRFTAVWVRHGDTWQVVSEHFCKLPDEPEQSR